jgi:hypothetical protein
MKGLGLGKVCDKDYYPVKWIAFAHSPEIRQALNINNYIAASSLLHYFIIKSGDCLGWIENFSAFAISLFSQ